MMLMLMGTTTATIIATTTMARARSKILPAKRRGTARSAVVGASAARMALIVTCPSTVLRTVPSPVPRRSTGRMQRTLPRSTV